MEIGLIGLGKMGLNLAQNMQDHGLTVKAFDLMPEARTRAAEAGVTTTDTLPALIDSLQTPRLIWVMVPAGKPTKATLQSLRELATAGDRIIDGGNSYYQDSLAEAKAFDAKQMHFFDVGSSGGMSGARANGNFMIGGDKAVFATIEPLFEAIAQPGGYLYTGPAGSGHYLKMVHNGIEYGMMAAIGEGFDVLANSPFDYDNEAVAAMWDHGSVIRGWLMALAADAFSKDPKLKQLKGVMHSSGEGAWTVEEGIRQHTPTPVITAALMARYNSERTDTMTGKVVAALRNEFGGHPIDKN